MQKITIDEYHKQQAACDNLCDITEEVAVQKDYLRCVTCPFCKATVDAVLTKSSISCPACLVTVSR